MEEYTQYLIAKGYAKDTRDGMLKITKRFLAWMQTSNIEPATLNYNDITAYVKSNQERNIKTRTVQAIINHVKHYLNYLVDAGIITHNPSLALKIKNTKRKIVYNILSPGELETIYKEYKSQLPEKPVPSSPLGGVRGGRPPQTLNKLARKRNKVLLGLFIYQGIAPDEVKHLEVKHLELREGKITIPGTKRSNERTLKLESHQIFDLYDYTNEIRKEMLRLTQKESTALFISTGTASKMQHALQKLTNEITGQNSKVDNLHQIRASVITNWLKQYNKRKVQYMAGHRYVSSTEAYEANNIEALQEDLQKYYPQL